MTKTQEKQKNFFSQRVIAIVQAIPKGEVRTYGEVAKQAGSPRAARAVGMIMKNNIYALVPCHRVVKADGTLGGYNGLRGTKADVLQQEGYMGSSST